MKGWVVGIAITAAFVWLMGLDSGWWESSDNDTTVPALSSQDSADLVARLAEAEEAHGICYGWELRNDQLSSDAEVVSSGSSRGVGVPADTCAKHMTLQAAVSYTDSLSESEDSATITVASSRDLTTHQPYSSDLDRMGVTTVAVLEDPAAATGLGALALPLLMVESGAAEPLPLSPAPADAAPISRPGSDFISTNRGALTALGILGGIALLCLIVGLIIRGKEARTRP
ncbi:hypothetical protein ACTG9Q_11010 [Actinokineospora sp. 24-640]